MEMQDPKRRQASRGERCRAYEAVKGPGPPWPQVGCFPVSGAQALPACGCHPGPSCLFAPIIIFLTCSLITSSDRGHYNQNTTSWHLFYYLQLACHCFIINFSSLIHMRRNRPSILAQGLYSQLSHLVQPAATWPPGQLGHDNPSQCHPYQLSPKSQFPQTGMPLTFSLRPHPCACPDFSGLRFPPRTLQGKM